jgi:hypothetical protein
MNFTISSLYSTLTACECAQVRVKQHNMAFALTYAV